MENIVLECKNVYKKIGKREIIKNVSFDLREGDILGFIGLNGAGKTTTIKLILGLQKLTSGSIKINGYDIKKEFRNAIEKVGAIVETPDSYMYMSGYDNLKLVADLYKNVDNDRICEVVKKVGLENRIYDKVSKYSLGMKQRLGIAIAILNNPNILILDEPTNGLDPDGIVELRKLLIKLAHEEGIGILISSHNLSEIDSLCNRICIIKNGEIIEETSMEKIKDTGRTTYILALSSTENIKDIVEEEIEVLDKHTIKVKMEKENIFEFAEKINMRGIKVYGMKREVESLEQTFLRKVGGDNID